uniref:Uncharacterized protein n=1 Tax=Timema douglasi TaxID=61478 RepID=A0A7R8Z5J4_TIMDO|nr:unnamed protein product [Timema douglasi]
MGGWVRASQTTVVTSRLSEQGFGTSMAPLRVDGVVPKPLVKRIDGTRKSGVEGLRKSPEVGLDGKHIHVVVQSLILDIPRCAHNGPQTHALERLHSSHIRVRQVALSGTRIVEDRSEQLLVQRQTVPLSSPGQFGVQRKSQVLNTIRPSYMFSEQPKWGRSVELSFTCEEHCCALLHVNICYPGGTPIHLLDTMAYAMDLLSHTINSLAHTVDSLAHTLDTLAHLLDRLAPSIYTPAHSLDMLAPSLITLPTPGSASLKAPVSSLEAEIQKLNGEQLVSLKDNINTLFRHCITTLGHEHNIRVVYALQTLCAVIHSIYKKTSGEFGFDVINILMGFDVAEQMMKMLLEHCSTFLTGEYPASLKALCLKLLLVLVTGTDNVSQNTLLEYLMMNSIFEALIQLLCEPATRALHGHDAVLLLTLLVNYRKHEAANPYIVKLSILDDELALNGYGQVITSCLTDFCRQFTAQHTEPQSASWLSSLTNIVGNMFVSEEGVMRTQQIRANNAVLVALYEAVHLNRNFITTLAHTQTDTSAPPSPSNTLNSAQPTPDLTTPTPVDIITQPSNLLVTFFQY